MLQSDAHPASSHLLQASSSVTPNKWDAHPRCVDLDLATRAAVTGGGGTFFRLITRVKDSQKSRAPRTEPWKVARCRETRRETKGD
jgi:hypothetical protein